MHACSSITFNVGGLYHNIIIAVCVGGLWGIKQFGEMYASYGSDNSYVGGVNSRDAGRRWHI